MRISMNVTNYSWPCDPVEISSRLAAIARNAENAGVDTIWVPDHLLQVDPNSKIEAEMLESYTTLGFLAGQTRRIRLGTMVTAATYRPAGLLSKIVTTLDVLSGGRAWLGIGSGYSSNEAQALGLPLPLRAERYKYLEDTLQLFMRMSRGDDTAFEGKCHRMDYPVNNPLPLTRPHPPILIGGMGETKTLPLVARYADACNLFDKGDGGEAIRHKMSVLERCCGDIGRPFDEITVTVSARLQPNESADEFVARCAKFAELGVGSLVLINTGPWTEERVATVAEAVPQVETM